MEMNPVYRARRSKVDRQRCRGVILRLSHCCNTLLSLSGIHEVRDKAVDEKFPSAGAGLGITTGGYAYRFPEGNVMLTAENHDFGEFHIELSVKSTRG